MITEIRDLVKYLNEATKAYDEGQPIISDSDWDKNYFKLQELERESGIILNNSPTQAIHYEVVNALEKVEHNHKMLSLEKTKDINVIKSFIGSNTDVLAMCKMDGLTCSLTYENGVLVSAETRGNGFVGENILHNAKVIPSIPKRIHYKEKLVVDGEIICTYDNFKNFSSDYKNPRNFAAGSIRLLDSKECQKRNLSFIAWDVLQGYPTLPTVMDKLIHLVGENFTIVPWNKGEVEFCIEDLVKTAEILSYPIDGIVFKFNDIEYGRSLGETSHHFKNAMAYKFYDETYWTSLIDIEWTMGRTGILTPVAKFEPIDIDGSIIERASLHNLSVMSTLLGKPYVGQKISVFKANMIIPQIESAEKIVATVKNGEYIKIPQFIEIPDTCPVCGEHVSQRTSEESIFLECCNPACEGKLINRIEHFASKKGLDIKGVSKATIEKLIDWEWITSCSDLFTLASYRDNWIKKPGFGPKSVDKILNAIEVSCLNCDLTQFIAALGIPLIGTSAAKELAKTFKTWDAFYSAIKDNYSFFTLPNFGYEMNSSLLSFDYSEASFIADNFIKFKNNEQTEASSPTLEGLTFVVTGKLVNFKNRDEITSLIESLGGKVSGSVSKNTSYLINNDTESTSSKNKSAKSLGIPILSEYDFIQFLESCT